MCKKNKAFVSRVFAVVMSATAVISNGTASAFENKYAIENDANKSYSDMFESLYNDVITNGQQNGYLSKNNNGLDSFGIPYHSVETMVVEAPDYGHETTSEAMSYMVWITAMHDVLAKKGLISDSSSHLSSGWQTLESLIPGYSVNAYQGSVSGRPVDYSTFWKLDKCKADTLTEQPNPSEYPEKQQSGGDALNPIFKDMCSAYGSDNGYYLMHWLADVDDWYGFGGGNGKLTFINTFQRGEQESCFETVPHPCLEELKYGSTKMADNDNGNGIKAIFNGDNKVPKQYAFTNAPDAENRAIQAIYFAQVNGIDCGTATSLAGKIGDQCRNNMFDKYYKKIGCQSLSSSTASKKDSQHYLMSWYTSWGGALDASYGNYSWGWQISCSHSHQFYQNPLAAYALSTYNPINIGMMANGATEDYYESLKRQIEFYLWLQSKDGLFAGGCTNSKGGQYQKYDSSDPLFYDMCYVEHPVYADPGSNHWIGNQMWSTQRLAELYYYIVKNGDQSNNITCGGLTLREALDTLLSRWVDWFIDNTKFNYTDKQGNTMAYAIPESVDWSGKPASWNGKYNANANEGLTCKITAYSQSDVGCVSSLCNTLIYYAAANNVDAAAAQTGGSSRGEKALELANKLLTMQWNLGRDDIGISFEECNESFKRIFEQEVYIPSYYKGKMPDGSPINGGERNTFSSIRKKYENDPMWQECKKIYDATGETDDYKFKLHRFWHVGDAIMAYGTMTLLYPSVAPYNN